MRARLLIASALVVTQLVPGAGYAQTIPMLVIRDSAALKVSDAHLRYEGGTLKLSGRICRRAYWFGMQPTELDIDRVAADGSRAEHADAYLPRLSLRIDQSCGQWQTQFKGPIATGDRILLCVPRPHSHCKID
ncbi:hypothetical protein [Novosphingobium sp.]|uniref:hypothetical protein n=1 Tax=Novosphingobium sp. TaxID=1874826 RepID=UPI003B52A293